ncbi:TIGR03749 family integrating conjugative element protein [Vibrio parahaemolyticus]|uniref:TIGR03749 family integrating conjugative element protein n=1 Tax=Vibrio parahaemolyticus TaxID=670 RepID=UPI001E3CF901|nr:TIGR03749 family integrating conjugative element protein [Vibrio parahaemolyticus]MCD1416982.1 TIGR03749 family integrating conjugative element protein [Vibrio parahaemolyticus]
MSIRTWVTCVGLLLSSACAFASTPRAMEWRGVPLHITLTPGQETIVNVGSDVRVARPAQLGAQLSVDSLAGRIYLTANTPFDVARLQVMRLSDGMRLLLDVEAKAGVVTPPEIDVVLPGNALNATPTQGSSSSQAEQHMAALGMAPEALLVRYAMQNLYSPEQAIEPLPGVVRAPMGLPQDIAGQTFAKWRVNAKPIAAWQLGDKVVTAIRLTNLSSNVEPLDPRLVTLGGACLQSGCSVSFSHPELGAAGSQTEQATAFLVTPGPLASHLLLPLQKEAQDD